MTLYRRWQKNTGFKSLQIISRPLAFCALLLPFLGGCGSEDSFPGTSNNQDPDPLITDIPMLYIERPLRADDMDPSVTEEDSIKDPLTFHGNARLFMKVRAQQSAPSVDLTARAVPGNVDVRDLDVSADGNLVLFSLRAPQIEDADEEDQPTWNIWEYNIEDDSLRRVMNADTDAEKGHDITPRFLADGRIIFASTRQQKSRSILQDEGKDQFSHLEENRQQAALNLHVMNADGSGIEQVTFNQSHDFHPVVMTSGKVVFSRWENFRNDDISLYEMNPDGTGLQLLYGHHSQGTGVNGSQLRFVRSNQMPEGGLFALARPDRTSFYGGNFIRIDTAGYIDNTRPVAGGSGSGPAQTPVTDRDIRTDGSISPGGYFSAFYPLWDNTNRALVSWSLCQLVIGNSTLPCTPQNLANSSAVPATPAYGIWIYNYVNNSQVPVVLAREGIVYTDVVLGSPRTNPTVIADQQTITGLFNGVRKVSPDTLGTLISNDEAIIHVRSMYDFDGNFRPFGSNASGGLASIANPLNAAFTNRPARFLRVIKAVSEPPRDLKNPANGSFGNAGDQRMKEIIGYAPIEPDGSVKVRVPANVALMLAVVDASGKAIRFNNNNNSGELLRHQNWISLRAGEVMECKGCHTSTSTAPHGRYDAQPASINTGQANGNSYPGTNGAITARFNASTMAEARVATAASISPADEAAVMQLSTDLLYNDVWSSTPEAAISLRYDDLPDGLTSPASLFCTPTWTSLCRIVIHYETHIQPIWELERLAIANPGHEPVDPGAATCVRCHSRINTAVDPAVPQVPAGQLELTAEVDGTNGVQNRAYVELFNTDVAQLLDEGALVDCTQEEPVVDENGDPVLDENGDPTFQTLICDPSEGPYVSSNGARASSAFFNLFEGAGSHVGYLSPAELRLIAEWLDIGGQYYNNHFAAPDN